MESPPVLHWSFLDPEGERAHGRKRYPARAALSSCWLFCSGKA